MSTFTTTTSNLLQEAGRHTSSRVAEPPSPQRERRQLGDNRPTRPTPLAGSRPLALPLSCSGDTVARKLDYRKYSAGAGLFCGTPRTSVGAASKILKLCTHTRPKDGEGTARNKGVHAGSGVAGRGEGGIQEVSHNSSSPPPWVDFNFAKGWTSAAHVHR